MSQESQPLVSIVIPCYNHAEFVQDCIRSVIDQTYQNIELIIIDDGSNDNSVEKIQELFNQCKARFTRFEFRYRPNKGLSETLNEALEWCQGEYYSAIASDDMMLSNKTQLQVEHLHRNKACVAVFGGYDLINETNETLLTNVGENKIYSFEEILMHNHELPAPTQMIVLTVLKRIEGYTKGIIIEDWYMWLKLSAIAEIHYISEKLALYRTHENNISKKIDIMHEGRKQVLLMHKDHQMYKDACLKAEWIWLSELRATKSNRYLFSLLCFLMKNPNYFLFKFKNRYLR